MGARSIQKRHTDAARSRHELRVLAGIMAAVGLPLALAYILVAADMRSDLSSLKPGKASPNFTVPLAGWPELEIGRDTPVQPSRRVRMLGYMMDGYELSRNGQPVITFMLMPEAGVFLHPAHRIPDEMVEVWLEHPAPFRFRTLVWATGRLERVSVKRGSGTAAWTMDLAQVEPAEQQDITRWFDAR